MSARDYGDHHHLGPLRRSGDVPLEVHVRLAPSGGPFDTDLDALWERGVADPGPGAIVRLAPDDLLLHLSAHLAFNDGFRAGLIAYADIDRTVRRFEDELDWERLVRTATADGRARHARAVLDLAGRLFDTPVPGGLWTTRAPAPPAGLAEAVLGELFDPRPLPPEAARGLAEAPGLGGKVREAIRFFFPPRRELRRRYGEGAGPLYLRRWADLARRRGGAIVRRLSPAVRAEDRERHLRLMRIETWVRGEDAAPAPEGVSATPGGDASGGAPGPI